MVAFTLLLEGQLVDFQCSRESLMWKYLLLGVKKWLSGENFPELFTFNYVDVCVSFSVALCSTVQWCAMYIRWHIVLLNTVERNFQTFTEHFEIGGFISSWVIATFNSGAMCISSPRKTCRRSPENLWVNLFSLWSCFTCKQHDIIFVSFEQNQHWYWPALISSSSFNKMLIIIKKVIHSFQGHFWIHISFVLFFTKITFKISDFLASVRSSLRAMALESNTYQSSMLKLTLQNISFPSASFFLAQNKTKNILTSVGILLYIKIFFLFLLLDYFRFCCRICTRLSICINIYV